MEGQDGGVRAATEQRVHGLLMWQGGTGQLPGKHLPSGQGVGTILRSIELEGRSQTHKAYESGSVCYV